MVNCMLNRRIAISLQSFTKTLLKGVYEAQGKKGFFRLFLLYFLPNYSAFYTQVRLIWKEKRSILNENMLIRIEKKL